MHSECYDERIMQLMAVSVEWQGGSAIDKGSLRSNLISQIHQINRACMLAVMIKVASTGMNYEKDTGPLALRTSSPALKEFIAQDDN